MCPRCGPCLEELPWLARYSRVTRRLAESVARLCQCLALKHAATFFRLSWDQVKSIDKTSLEQRLGPVDLTGIEVIAMDEFALHKGHRYATVIVDPRSKRVLWVGRGHTRESVRPFFELLGEGRKRLKAVVMDMNAAYEQEVRHHCPQARIVYDLFHVIAKYGREVIGRVRVDEANRVRQDPGARKVIKGSLWLLLRNRENLRNEEERIRLNELLAANRNLLIVYVLKEELKQLWGHRSPWPAYRSWKQWYGQAMQSGIDALMKFARKLKPYLRGILSHCVWPLHTSLLEGINNKIKVIKRIAYGFRDDEYFFLKIRAAFPGIPG
jgi:transposase